VRHVATALVGLALAVFVVGLTLIPLTMPFATRALAERFALAEEAGLPPQRMLEVAEQVRAFVAGPAGSRLPDQVDGRPGFDASAVSHLADVRRVILAARTATWVLALLLGVWLAVALSLGRTRHVSRVMFAGALWCAVLVLLAALAGTLDFEALFSAFHGLFFAAGTWTFSADSLLIQTFPEQFWATAAAVWAVLILATAAALAVCARLLLGLSEAPSASASGGFSVDRA
jgi:integral membrane protein (TIGR01906 family)